MKNHEIQELATLIAGVLSYYRQDTSDFAMQVWLQACKPFELEQVRKALTAHAADPDRGQFAPKVADIVRLLQGTRTDKAVAAWSKAHEAAGSVGAYRDVVFDDQAIHAVIDDLGGWVKFCRTETDDLSYLQHRFCEAHRAYAGRGQFDYPRVLAGARSPDSEFRKIGMEPPRPTLVGDAARCQDVYLNGNADGRVKLTHAPLALIAAGHAGAETAALERA